MRKKFISILLIYLVSACFVGCGNTDTKPTEQTETVESTEQSTPERIASTEQPTVEPEEVDTTEQAETEAPTEEPVETLTETPEVVDEPQAQYTYTDLSATMYAQKTVNVRDLPSTDGNKLGGLSTNQEVTVTGQCNETSWYRIDYNDSVGYVSNNYLGDSTVEVAQTSAENNGGNSLESFPYPMNQLLGDPDNGYYIYFVPNLSSENDLFIRDLTVQAINEITYAEFQKGSGLTGVHNYTEQGSYAEGQVRKVDIYPGTW